MNKCFYHSWKKAVGEVDGFFLCQKCLDSYEKWRAIKEGTPRKGFESPQASSIAVCHPNPLNSDGPASFLNPEDPN